MFYFPSLFRGNSFNAPATTDNKERNQSEEKTSPDTDYPEPLDPASLKKIELKIKSSQVQMET